MKQYLCRLFILSSTFLLLTSCVKTPSIHSSISKSISAARLNIEREGPKIKCRKISPEELKDKFERTKPIENTDTFVIEEINFSIGESYLLFMRKHEAMILIGNYTVNNDHKLIGITDNRPISECCLFLEPCLPGEEVFILLINQRSSEVITTLVAQNPIETTWEDGAYASLRSCVPSRTFFLFSGKGFPPNEVLEVISCSEDEKIYSEIPTGSDGSFYSMIFPAVVGKPTGNSKLIIRRTKTGEVRSLNYTYGKLGYGL